MIIDEKAAERILDLEQDVEYYKSLAYLLQVALDERDEELRAAIGQRDEELRSAIGQLALMRRDCRYTA